MVTGSEGILNLDIIKGYRVYNYSNMLVIQATEAQPPKNCEQKSIQIKHNISSFVQSHNFLLLPKCFLKSMFTCFSSYCPLSLTAPSSAPPSPSCRLTPSSDFVSPYLICGPSQSVGLQPRGRCGRKHWCWR